MDPELEANARKRIGLTIREKYRIDALLGVGGMAVVYRATHRNKAEFAIKMLHPELSMRESWRQRFLREGYAANSVKHPGVVAVVDEDVAEDGAAFLVMELLTGSGVDVLAKRNGKRLPIPAACVILDQLLDVLAAAHEQGIVHRDIKPANLFLTTDGTVKVLDFGIARVRDAMTSDKGLTNTGDLLGTPGYMAPEQALGEQGTVGPRTDLWAAAATFFKLASGKLVHTGENATQLMLATATKMPRSVATVADLHPSIARVIDRGLDFDFASRWANAGDMQSALRAAMVEAFGSVPTRQVLSALLAATGNAPVAVGEPSAPVVAVAHSEVFTPTPLIETNAARKQKGWGLPILAAVAIAVAVGVAVRALAQGSARTNEVVALPNTTTAGQMTTVAAPKPPETMAPPTPDELAASHRAPVKKPTVPTASVVVRAHPIAAPLTNCEPPYYFDENNNKVFKKDCL